MKGSGCRKDSLGFLIHHMRLCAHRVFGFRVSDLGFISAFRIQSAQSRAESRVSQARNQSTVRNMDQGTILNDKLRGATLLEP